MGFLASAGPRIGRGEIDVRDPIGSSRNRLVAPLDDGFVVTQVRMGVADREVPDVELWIAWAQTNSGLERLKRLFGPAGADQCSANSAVSRRQVPVAGNRGLVFGHGLIKLLARHEDLAPHEMRHGIA